MSGVISATDYFEELRLGRAGFERLVRSRAIEAHSTKVERPTVDLEAELDIRERRLAELREFAVRRRRVEELQRSVVWTKPAPAAPSPPSTAKPAWSKARPTQTATKKREYPWSVALKPHVRSGFDVYLDGDVCRSITGWVIEAAPYGLETGGYLFGHQPLRSSGGVVGHASGPAPNSKHGRHSVSLGNEADVRDEIGLDGEYFRRLGCWHSHPSGAATPSTADMDAWAQYLWARDRQCVFDYLSIIVTPGAGGLGPEFHGWVTHGERGHYVCQPALLSDRLGYSS